MTMYDDLRTAAEQAVRRDADGNVEGVYIQWDPLTILRLLDIANAAQELVDSWYSGDEGPAYLGLRDAVYRAK